MVVGRDRVRMVRILITVVGIVTRATVQVGVSVLGCGNSVLHRVSVLGNPTLSVKKRARLSINWGVTTVVPVVVGDEMVVNGLERIRLLTEPTDWLTAVEPVMTTMGRLVGERTPHSSYTKITLILVPVFYSNFWLTVDGSQTLTIVPKPLTVKP